MVLALKAQSPSSLVQNTKLNIGRNNKGKTKLSFQITNGFDVVIYCILIKSKPEQITSTTKNSKIYTFRCVLFLRSIICLLLLCQHAYHFISLPPISFPSGGEYFLSCPRKYETFGTEKLIFPLHQMLLLFKLISRNSACVRGLHALSFSHAKKLAINARDRIPSCFCPVHVKVSWKLPL